MKTPQNIFRDKDRRPPNFDDNGLRQLPIDVIEHKKALTKLAKNTSHEYPSSDNGKYSSYDGQDGGDLNMDLKDQYIIKKQQV